MRRLKLAAAMFSAKAEEVDELRSAIEVGQKEVYALRSAVEQQQHASELWESAYKKQKGKATRKTLLWVLIGIAGGILIQR